MSAMESHCVNNIIYNIQFFLLWTQYESLQWEGNCCWRQAELHLYWYKTVCFKNVYLIFGFSVEGELILWLSWRNLVNSEPFVCGLKHRKQILKFRLPDKCFKIKCNYRKNVRTFQGFKIKCNYRKKITYL